MRALLTLLLLIITVAPVLAEEEDVPDSTLPIELPDSLLPADTLLSPDDSGDSLLAADSLSEEAQAKALIEEKLQQYQQQQARLPVVSIFDSLVVYFAGSRLNRRADIDRSFFHDAGDYFRFSPSFFVLAHQVTPMRKTVQPFGLRGDRLNLLVNGHRYRPFEHIPEPDGLTDLGDIPTALDDDVYVLSGPIGQVFGGQSAIASLVTHTSAPESNSSESALRADKGGYDYSYVRGRYSKQFVDGRDIDMSIGYRNADGPAIGRESDQYQYFGDFYFPAGRNAGLHAWGQLLDRSGPLVVRPEFGGASIRRNRFDRSARVSVAFDSDDRDARLEFGYKHRRQGLRLKGVLAGRFDRTGHGLFVHRQWMWTAATVGAVKADADYLEYADEHTSHDRFSGKVLVQLAKLKQGWRYAATAGASWTERYPVLPQAALVLQQETPGWFLQLSAGYSERAPTMHELYLRHQQASLYGSGPTYAEQGSDHLNPERQLVGGLLLQLGSPTSNIGLSATGGRISDGIDWSYEEVSDTTGAFVPFTPENRDVVFADVALEPRLKLGDFLTFSGGAAYHYLDYDGLDARAYSPEYQAFSGLELHLFWPQKLMDLFAYGEIVYTGEYHGYAEEELGNVVVANAKLSFAVKDYRMHFVFQNVLSQSYRAREFFTNPGRYFYYGFIWQFLN